MAVINKVLNILIALLAVATCVVSFNMYNKRAELKGRGDKLALAVESTAKTLDGEGVTSLGTSNAKTFSKEAMSWKAYHEDNTAYEKTINTLSDAAQTVVDLKADLARGAVEIAKVLETPEAAKDGFERSLNFASGSKASLEAITSHAAAVKDHSNSLVAGIVATSKAMGKPVSEEALHDIEDKAYEKSLEILADNAQSLKRRANDLSTSYAESVAKLKKALGERFRLRTDEDLLKSESAQDYKEAISDFQTKDVPTIAKAIGKYNRSEQVIAKLQADNVEQAEEIRILEKNSHILKTENTELVIHSKSKDVRISKLMDELNRTVPKDLVAGVLSFDDKYDFVIIDKGSNDQLVESAELIIHRDFNYVCKVIVSKVYKDKAVCEIIDTAIKQGNPAAGDVVIVHP